VPNSNRSTSRLSDSATASHLSLEAAKQVVTDLFNQLSRGGTLTVHIEDADGKEQTLEVTARR
jgi:hypothetical protein